MYMIRTRGDSGIPELLALFPGSAPPPHDNSEKEEESLVPFHTWCAAHWRHSYSELICYVTTRVCSDRSIERNYIDSDDSERIYVVIQAARDTGMVQVQNYIDSDDSERIYVVIQAARDTGMVQVQNTTYSCQTLWLWKLLLQTDKHHLLHSLVISLQQVKTCNSQKYRVTELSGLHELYLNLPIDISMTFVL